MFCANQFEYYFENLSAAEVVDTFPDLVSATEKPMLYMPIGIKSQKVHIMVLALWIIHQQTKCNMSRFQ